MYAKIAKGPLLILGLVVLISVVGAGVLFLSIGTASKAETTYLPTMTMVYEIDGQVHNGVVIKETHRLEYNSASDWTDTVIASDPIESLALGTITATGSYTRRDGNQFKTYDSVTDDSSVVRITDSIVIPNQFLGPLLIFAEGADLNADPPITSTGKTLSEVNTTARVCYLSECESNVSALEFDRGYGNQWTVLNDARWGIPLKVGDTFIVKELTLGVSKN
ncbi:MAG: hypothetical protein OXI16_14905 [Chloroflexota bacterium]|nr:hypothetical protein [Chloroflexota bacterium]